jgi:hypothetical protein
MSSPNHQSPHCRVVDGDKLPAASGGADALCAAIEQAMSSRAPGVAFSAEIRVLSSSRLAATLTRDGHKLPEQNFASMDRELTSSSFDRFAQTLANQLAEGRR